MNAHSFFGGSTMSRLLACPGSVREILEGAHDNLSGEAAERGTRIHKAAEEILRIGAVSGDLEQDEIDMAADYAEWLITDSGGDVFWIEMPVDLSAFAPGAYGTADAVYVRDDTLHVVDLKTGWAPVDAERNPQLMFYALGVALSPELDGVTFHKVRLTIWQNGPRSWDTDLAELLTFGDKLADVCLRAKQADAPKKAGSHCRYCPAAATCGTLRGMLSEFNISELDPSKFDSAEAMAEALDVADVAEVFAKAVKDRADALIADGLKVRGWGREPGRSTTVWAIKDEDELLAKVEQLAPEAGVLERDLVRPKTITEVKKILGKKCAKAVDALTVKKPGALKLKRQQTADELFGI